MTYVEKKSGKAPGDEISFAYSGMETRIAAVADLYESRKQAAATAQVALSSLQRWISGDGMPAFGSVALLASGKGVSLDWIATGKGEMFLINPGRGMPRQEDEDVYAYIPLYDARCSSGHGAWNERAKVLTKLAFTRYSLRKKGLNPESLACLRNDGDSMKGLIEDEDTVMIDQNRNSLEGEGVYVILLDDHLYAKRLQRQFDGAVLIISHNKEYQPMTVPRDRLAELQIVGRAVWAGGWLI
ncbi:helix-turn-helix transcriptional regulator [Pseudomonas citronellolis]|uniref:Helix-turn-helix transcriptional regulator n=1 Tax=Pseudomonas citronellolis TaxID=53408 RepID=A0AAW6NZC1_9PSED|nr:helix-turn-helix transcriptional regulator [Pseudomonas citronellolis]MDF3840448.1 helix-turn-helix transcriptional regulator [Pseudomonas citronellolis]WRT82980.1 helix-turn-helix transcriptional regulator [Pseudomonas citronellolis]